ncbi:DoxX family protein [Limimaricola litoreus]|uniref:DoxX family protein n=1 Tax=Limimaricola litoreus TaxID=2955316 RepID=A0A9X2FZY8_9RHOB|nr:DoxX family protein [Limimaricola litoreus]MCP1170208.1 DoxX family protein [Limimaricola litoreus]
MLATLDRDRPAAQATTGAALRADDWLLLIGRVLLAGLFLGGAAQKAFEPGQVVGLLTGWHLPGLLVWPALAYNAAAGLALAFGVAVRPVALSLALYCMVTSVFHFLPEDPWQMTIFVKNWAIAGGCLALAVAGAGRISVRLS